MTNDKDYYSANLKFWSPTKHSFDWHIGPFYTVITPEKHINNFEFFDAPEDSIITLETMIKQDSDPHFTTGILQKN